jgi:hypothetical protein
VQKAASIAGLRIGVVGALQVNVAGAVAEHGTLASVASDPLVRVDAGDPATRLLRTAAAAHPATHFALVGGPAAALHLANVVGLVIRDDEAALLGGVAAGLSASEQSGPNARVAWVGPEERSLASAFARGVHTVAPKVVVLRVWSPVDPASCKEAALEAVARGASAVMAHAGECASAAIAAAHERNQPGLRLSDFELPGVAAAGIVRDAVRGVYHGHDDIVFGAASGAVGVRMLDPLIAPATAVRVRTASQELASGLRPSG